MDPQVVLVFTWVVAGVVVAAYVWFVVWRYRVERRKKAAQDIEDSSMSASIARTVERMSGPTATVVPPAGSGVARAARSPTGASPRSSSPGLRPEPPSRGWPEPRQP